MTKPEASAISLEFSEREANETDAEARGHPGVPSVRRSAVRSFLRGVAAFFFKVSSSLGSCAPKGLYARALIIIIAPVIILQSILTFVFLDRHWQVVTRRLSTATAQDIAMLASTYELMKTKSPEALEGLADIAQEKLNLSVRFLPSHDLPVPRPRPFFDLVDRYMSDEVRYRIHRPVWIDTVGRSDFIEIRVKLDDAVMRVVALRAQLMPSNTHIFLVWMVVSATVLLIVAILFLRNQIRPILSLAEAADRFGRGRPAPPDFKVRGAREVRLAAQAFLEMRERIERHVEQRTIMLAGVSHDLRTILTRFRLQFAMMRGPQVEALRRDVDEMQAMLEDYLAFANGDSGEETRSIDVQDVFEEVQEAAETHGKAVELEIRQAPLVVSLRRNAFKRALTNLVTNAARYADRIVIGAVETGGWLTVTVEDNGLGIPADKREEVFRPFHSLDAARNQNKKSTGLGLAITRDIIRSHGGEITLAESALGGLKAIIRIPVAAAENGA